MKKDCCQFVQKRWLNHLGMFVNYHSEYNICRLEANGFHFDKPKSLTRSFNSECVMKWGLPDIREIRIIVSLCLNGVHWTFVFVYFVCFLLNFFSLVSSALADCHHMALVSWHYSGGRPQVVSLAACKAAGSKFPITNDDFRDQIENIIWHIMGKACISSICNLHLII